jgi:YD repeat-containing protein
MRALAGLAIAAVLVQLAAAGVNLKNGNFYVTHTDLDRPDGFKIERTYNSRSRGVATIFGYGWGYNFGDVLEMLPEGHLRLTSHGAGRTTEYLIAPSLKPGVQRWRSSQGQDAEYDGQTFRVKSLDGDELIFGNDGQLIEVFKGKKSYLRIERAQGDVVKIHTSAADPISLTYTTAGLVQSIAADGKTATYEYLASGMMARSLDAGGNTHGYGYDRNRSMTAISYADGSALSISYDAANQITALVDRTGETINYYYGQVNDDWYWTLTYRVSEGYPAVTLYEYEIHAETRATARTRTWTLPEAYAGGPVSGDVSFSEQTYNEGGQSLGSSRGTAPLPQEFLLPAKVP